MDSESDTDSTIRALAVALKSVKTGTGVHDKKHQCDFCGRTGHTEDRCYQNPSNPDNKLPPKLREMFQDKAAAAVAQDKTRPKKTEIAGSLVEKTTLSPPKDHRSYADSGATCHCFHSRSVFVQGSLTPCKPRHVMLADKTSVTSTHMGEVVLPFEHANIRLQNVLYIPNLGYNLVSTGKLADNGIQSLFRRFDVRLSLQTTNFFIGLGSRDKTSGMYMLPEPVSQNTQMAMSVTSDSKFRETELWHRRLAHINMRDLVTMHQHANDVPHLQQSDDVCRACRLGKAHKLPFPGHFNRADAVGDILHSDIVGPLELSFPDKYNYFYTIHDDQSRYTQV
ncbi:GAG-pre-integrase domain-containing protein, partial [Pseudomonas sp. MAG002Y]|uniref:GAG-pre-integrase domain-containing protein n=1 Tax=Pseudomonas sp. MAG002Y TaxID=2678690 RepID=UPI001C60CBBE